MTGRNENNVDMSGMPPGIYFLIGFDKNGHPLSKGIIINKVKGS
jgi:hypothetical protein